MIMALHEGLICESMTLRVVIVLCRGNFKIGISTLNKDDAWRDNGVLQRQYIQEYIQWKCEGIIRVGTQNLKCCTVILRRKYRKKYNHSEKNRLQVNNGDLQNNSIKQEIYRKI